MQKDLYEGFQNPKSNTEEVLLTLITQGHVSIFDFPTLSGFRTRVSNLTCKHGLVLNTEMIEAINKFGNSYRYALHKLPEEEKEKAINLYKKLNKISNPCQFQIHKIHKIPTSNSEYS